MRVFPVDTPKWMTPILLSNTKDTVKIDGLMIIQLCLVTSLKIM